MANFAFDDDFVETDKPQGRRCETLPEGDYQFEVMNVVESEVKGSTHKSGIDHKMLKVELELKTADPEVTGMSTLWLHKLGNYIGYIKSFLINIKVMTKDQHFEAKFLKDIIGKKGAAHFTVSDVKMSKDGFTEYRDNICDKFIDDFDAVTESEGDDDCPF